MVFKYKKEVLTVIALLAAIAIIFSSLYLYTDNWPPAVIVESKSMQHGNNFVFGAINTGDIVGVKKVNTYQQVQTYIVGRERGAHFNYGEFGDVIIYRNYFLNELVIHRAIFYVQGWTGDTPILYSDGNPSWLSIVGSTVYINDVGYTHKNLAVSLQDYIGQTGFVTMGDYNFAISGYVKANYSTGSDQNVGIDNTLVNTTQVVGYAVGYLPIVGVLKLWGSNKLTDIPQISNVVMIVILILLVALILVPIPSGKREKETPRKGS